MSTPPYGGTPPAPAPWPPLGPTERRPSRGSVLIPTLIALLAIVLGAAALLKPTPELSPETTQQSFSAVETEDAKTSLCAVYSRAFKSVRNVGSKNSSDTTVSYILGVESQLAFNAAADALMEHLNARPATPADLAAAVTRLASSFNDIVLARLADADESEIAQISAEMDAAEAIVQQECDA